VINARKTCCEYILYSRGRLPRLGFFCVYHTPTSTVHDRNSGERGRARARTDGGEDGRGRRRTRARTNEGTRRTERGMCVSTVTWTTSLPAATGADAEDTERALTVLVSCLLSLCWPLLPAWPHRYPLRHAAYSAPTSSCSDQRRRRRRETSTMCARFASSRSTLAVVGH
jgi:hypothetical protein